MALILLASAGYAYYQVQMSKNFDVELDSGLDRDGKEAVDFLPNELTQGLLKMSLSTVTFCKGDYKSVAPLLEQKVKEIREANPWLTGFLAPPKEGGPLKLFYDSDTSSESFQKAPPSFKCYDEGEIPLTQVTPFKQYDDICECYDIKVAPTDKLVGKNAPLWKVYVIPDAAEPEEKWILVVSLCRLLGDAHTFYSLYNQLSISGPVSSLNPRRKVESRDEAVAHVGQTEFQYLQTLWESSNDAADKSPLKSFFRGSASKEAKDPTPTHEILVFRVAPSWMEQEKEKYPDCSDEGSLIVSCFFRTIRPEVVMLAMPLRRILPALNDYDAGNYQTPVPMLSDDYDPPQGIHSCQTTGKRKTHGETPLPDSPASFGIAADWSQFGVAVGGSNESDLFEQTHHFPLMNTADLLFLPKDVCAVVVFNAAHGQLGAMGIVPKGMVSEFHRIGIVDQQDTQLAKSRYKSWKSTRRASQLIEVVYPDGVVPGDDSD